MSNLLYADTASAEVAPRSAVVSRETNYVVQIHNSIHLYISLAICTTPFTFNHPLEWWDEAAYRSSRSRNKLPRFVVDRAVRITFRRRIASF